MSPLLLLLLLPLLLLAPSTRAQSAPAPAPSGPINITAILEKEGQYTRFIHFLNVTQAGDQLNNQVNNSREGMTLFAPTDNAFQNLPPGALNNLSPQQQVQLVQNHICPKYYSLTDLLSVSNPVRTLTTGQKGGVFGLNITGQNNQVNVSTGAVEVSVYNAVRKDFPLAVYQVDKVLMPRFDDSGDDDKKAPTAAPKGGAADGGDATAPSTQSPEGNGAARIGLVAAFWVMCMGLVL
ncbi:fasciclin-like arabinogalactan protein 9 [Salvia splendens]|uniref:fasciclin-like arabinogalactan protein 9 n=1 Tax=Salvia splendens TaxID=180675 RepID=UPI001C268B2C|nr:fasciclin-like arabinogalactan protein 9 [Salvia splendens]